MLVEFTSSAFGPVLLNTDQVVTIRALDKGVRVTLNTGDSGGPDSLDLVESYIGVIAKLTNAGVAVKADTKL